MLGREVRAELLFCPEFRMHSAAGHRLRELLGCLRRGFLSPVHKNGRGALLRREVEGELITLLLW